VAKASIWYLVGAAGEAALNRRVRVYRVSRVLTAQLTDQPFSRPDDFDLADFWQKWCASAEASRPAYLVTVRVAGDFVPQLRKLLAPRPDLAPEPTQPDAEGRVSLTLPFQSLEEARARLLGLGRAVEVLAPEMLRQSLMDFAAQTLNLYQGKL
jgi:predicted DNA-binding transcriptional regulator YafY